MFQENTEILTFLYSVLFIIVSIIILIIFLLLFFIKKNNEWKIELEEYKLKFEKEILNTRVEIQEETFQKISREIHDNISLGLTLAKLQVNSYVEGMNPRKDLLSTSVELISKSLIDLNDISKSLDAKLLLSHGLIAAFESEIFVLNRSGIFNVDLEVTGEPVHLDSEKELLLLRIFQESCNNILKHALANKITVDLIYDDTSLLMKIVDNGRGVSRIGNKTKSVNRHHAGIQNMKSRTDMIGADFSMISFPKIGTTINVTLPFQEHAKAKRTH